MKPKFIFALILFFSFFSARSQKGKLSPEYPWRIESIKDNVFVFNEPNPSIANGIIYFEDSSAIMPLRYLSQGEGVAKIDRNGAILWQIHFNSGQVVATSKQGSGIIVFYETGTDGNYNTLLAMLIDPLTGKKVKEKQIFQENTSQIPDFKILNGPAGQLNNIIIRTTLYEGKKSFQWNKGRRLFQSTSKLSIIYLNEKLEITQNQDKNNFLDKLDFRGCLVNANHEIFLLGHKDDHFSIQKINSKGELVEKLESRVKPADDRYVMDLAISPDTQSPESVFVSLSSYEHGDRVLYNFLFDFNKKSVVASEPVIMNKAYKNSLSPATTPNSAITNLSFDDMRPVAVIQTQDQFVVLKTISGTVTTTKGPVVSTQLIVVSFYDRKLKLIGEASIDRAFMYYWPIGCSIGYHLKGDQLYLLASANSARESYVNLKATIDCTTRKITSLEEFASVDDSRRKFIEGANTLWFSDQYIVSQLVGTGLLSQTANTVFEIHEY